MGNSESGKSKILYTLANILVHNYNFSMKFYGELLVLVLLLITNLRVFFVNHVRRDPLVVMAPFSCTIAILQILSWGIDVFTAIAFIISVFVLLSNFHAMFRYSERLYVDHYSPLMKVWAVFTIAISLITIVAMVYFAPVEIHSRKNGITETQLRYKGGFKTGFEKANSFSTSDIIVYEFKNADIPDQLPVPQKGVVLFIPDKRGETINYKPYLQLLTKEGYTVYSADFYADDCKWMHSIEDMKILRRFAMTLHSLSNNQWFMAQREFYTYNISLELAVLKEILYEQYDEDLKYYLVSDVMGNTAIEDFIRNNPKTVKGSFFLDTIQDYKTAGYGCVEQTDPLVATALGLSRDSQFTTPNLLVKETLKAFEVMDK